MAELCKVQRKNYTDKYIKSEKPNSIIIGFSTIKGVGCMSISIRHNGGLTAEQFLFHEMRIVSKQYLDGKPIDMIVEYVKRDNLFQYPTERTVSRLTRACHKRILALSNEKLVYELVNAPVKTAKQINLYAMMRYNSLVREYMEKLIGEKYSQRDLSYTKKDVNVFFSQMQEQNDDVAAWSDRTVTKLKQVLTKCLVETEILDSAKATTLNPIFISAELETGIRENNDLTALAAFNCFK